MKHTLCILFMVLSFQNPAQELKTPSGKRDFTTPTSYEELTVFVNQLDASSEFISTAIIGKSVESRNLYALTFSTGRFGEDPSKLRVLFFAQQHGNEQSGKEGVLLLAATLIKPEYRYLFNRIDLALIPQVNPDGSESNKRRNANNMDLNRNHLIMTEPETQALHGYFEKYLFDVTLDVHEYSPYGEEWEKSGYRKNSEVTLGATTNVNVWKKIRDISNKAAIPFVLRYLNDVGYSSLVYCPGGPPGIDYIRHSTFDINDGRQSFGILNTFSFIQEGMNGMDSFVDNLQRRAQGQEAGMIGMLKYAYENSRQIRKMVSSGRKQLAGSKPGSRVAVQSDHFANGTTLLLPLKSYATQADTVVEVKDYRPVVKSTFDVKRPSGYLIPKDRKELMHWLELQNLTFSDYIPSGKDVVEQYRIIRLDSIDFERDIITDPVVESSDVSVPDASSYVFVPVNQLKSNLLILALEPKSMLGLATYKPFEHLLSQVEPFPVLRLIR